MWIKSISNGSMGNYPLQSHFVCYKSDMDWNQAHVLKCHLTTSLVAQSLIQFYWCRKYLSFFPLLCHQVQNASGACPGLSLRCAGVLSPGAKQLSMKLSMCLHLVPHACAFVRMYKTKIFLPKWELQKVADDFSSKYCHIVRLKSIGNSHPTLVASTS
jgi:hypothetical protein